MDPDTCWERICELAADINDAGDDPDPDTAVELAICVRDLEEWLADGGASPTAFQ